MSNFGISCRDFARYNNLETAAEAQEETGWKLVHGDVFRAPAHFSVFSVLVGTSAQLNAMCLITIVFAALGFLSPANRGALLNVMVLLFNCMSVYNGYFSARLYKFFKGVSWRANTLRAAFGFPAVVFALFLVMNHVISNERSSGAAPTFVLVMMVALWFGLSVPLVFLGAFFGYKKDEIEVPVRTNQIPRQVPESPWFMSTPVVCLVGGVLPFGAVLIELFFILSSLWQDQTYYFFGCLLLVYIILAVTCAEITIVFCYFQLCAEDYHWWWRSLATSGTSAAYIFAYSIYYLTHLRFDRFVDWFLYLGYMLIISAGFFLITGGIGFVATFWFIRTIYGAIKVD
jgi:transmembrane 9 superfamily protein 2/4